MRLTEPSARPAGAVAFDARDRPVEQGEVEAHRLLGSPLEHQLCRDRLRLVLVRCHEVRIADDDPAAALLAEQGQGVARETLQLRALPGSERDPEVDTAKAHVPRNLHLLHIGGALGPDLARRGAGGFGEFHFAERLPCRGVEDDVVGHQREDLVEVPLGRSSDPGADQIADRLFVGMHPGIPPARAFRERGKGKRNGTGCRGQQERKVASSPRKVLALMPPEPRDIRLVLMSAATCSRGRARYNRRWS